MTTQETIEQVKVGVQRMIDVRHYPSEGQTVDPDDEKIVTPQDVVAVLGFDPAKEDV